MDSADQEEAESKPELDESMIEQKENLVHPVTFLLTSGDLDTESP
jgi:hypothetical protein